MANGYALTDVIVMANGYAPKGMPAGAQPNRRGASEPTLWML